MTAQDSQEPKENNVSEPESSDHPAKSGWHDDPEGSGGLRWYDAKANKWSETASQATTISLEPDTTKDPEESRIQLQEDDKKQKAGSKTKNNEEASPIATLPAINNWKTSVGFSVLGCLSFLVFWFLLTFVLMLAIQSYIGGPITGSAAGMFAGPVAGVLTYILDAVYALVVYPSFFKEKPILKSSRAISFCNFFFGSIICGPLWNSNLTKSKQREEASRGSSHIVWAILCFVAILAVGAQFVTTTGPQINYVKSYYEQQSSSSTAAQSSQGAQQHEDDVFSITFPTKPEYESSDEGGVSAEYYKSKTDGCYVFVEVNRVNLDLQGENPYDFAAELAYSFLTERVKTSITEDDIDKGTFDGCPAGYVWLGSEESGSVILCSTMLGKGYVFYIIVQADTYKKVESIMDSLSLK